jgi:REP element-mobilizing transposase RayT
MARPLRIQRPYGRYHVTARGNERKAIYRSPPDRTHFLELLAEATERFGIRIHAYVLMENHYHLLLETPEANLSRVMQWVNVSYSLWFNRLHSRAGHLFQGRFKAVVVEDDAGWQELGRYVHLNPVRVLGLGLGKRQRAASRAGTTPERRAELVAERLRQLREFPWSSYRAYAGYGGGVGWLWRQPLDWLCGGKSQAERRAALRQHTEQPVRQGKLESPWERLVAGLVLGTETFAQSLRRQVTANAREQPPFGKLNPAVRWPQIIAALERSKGERWTQFSQRHGDWGRDAALWLGRRHGRYRLAELGELAGGMDYAAVGLAVSRFGRRLEQRRDLRQTLTAVEKELLNVNVEM